MRKPKPIGYALVEAKKGRAKRPLQFVRSVFGSFEVYQRRSHAEMWVSRRGGGCMIVPIYASEPEPIGPAPTEKAPTDEAGAFQEGE